MRALLTSILIALHLTGCSASANGQPGGGIEVRHSGRPWWSAYLAPTLFIWWSSYAFVVVPFLLEENAGIAGSESLGLILNSLFAVSIMIGYDQIAFAIPRAEEAKGGRRSGYVVTLLQLLFPPVALWIVHSRLTSTVKQGGTESV